MGDLEHMASSADIPAKSMKIYPYKDALKDSTEYFNGDEMAATTWINKYALKDASKQKKEGDTKNIILYEKSPKDMHERIAREIARVENNYKNPMSEKDIFDLLDHFKYIIPQGGPMSGIGNNLQTVSLSNCFVIGNKEKSADSYGAIMKIDQEQVQLMKRRGGVGHDLSYIRPKGSPVLNSALTSTGIVPFMERYSNSTREVAQDGRRGALMLSISSKHPDSEDFIDAKMIKGKVNDANVSVRIDDEFMEAVDNGGKYIQKFPVDSDNPIITKEVNAKKIWEKIVHNAWRSAEPGILFWDTIINESVPDCYADKGYKTVSTNPCGEIPLCPYDSCRLLAVNLYSYVDNPFTDKAKFNKDLFKKHIHYAQRIQDDIIDLELEKIDAILKKIKSDPEDDEVKRVEYNLWGNIKKKAEEGRRMGIGTTGEGDMLAALNLTYGSNDAIDFSTEVHKTVALEAYRSSVEMAKERGAFAIYDAEKEKNNPFINRLKKESPDLYDEMVKHGRRNISLLTIAPTGTTSMMTQTTSGIEPAFLPVYERRRKVNENNIDSKIVETDDEGNKWEKYKVFHHHFETWLKNNGYNVEDVKKIADESFYDKNQEEKLNEIVKKSPYYQATSNDVDWVQKVKMQGAIQKWIDHSISVTINLPSDAPESLVDELYRTAWKAKCKGVTVYREGSRGKGILNSGKENLEAKLFPDKRPKEIEADVLRFNNENEKWIALVGLIDDKPYEIFTGKSEEEVLAIPGSIKKGKIVKVKNGDDKTHYDFLFEDRNGFESKIGGISHQFKKEYWNYARFVSSMLRNGMDVLDIVDTVSKLDEGVEGINTWKAGVQRALKKYIKNGTKSKEICPTCHQSFIYQNGCKTCSCGDKCE
jgi:ribonucleoside-diphosphate reductase alpha chain